MLEPYLARRRVRRRPFAAAHSRGGPAPTGSRSQARSWVQNFNRLSESP